MSAIKSALSLSTELRDLAETQWRLQCTLPYDQRDLFGDNPDVMARVRQIGIEANALGSFPAMLTVCADAFLNADYSSKDEISSLAMAELNYAWSGIGDWQA